MQYVRPEVWKSLKHLQLLRPFRGTRGGKVAKSKLFQQQIIQGVNVKPSVSHSLMNIQERTHFSSSMNIQERILPSNCTIDRDLTRQSHIPVLINERPNVDVFINQENTKSINRNNLIDVPITCANGSNSIHFATWNAGSITKKIASICDFVVHNHIDILGLTETWLNGNSCDNQIIAELLDTLKDYVFHHLPRTHTSGGGIGFLLRKGFNVKPNVVTNFKSFEYIDLNVTSQNSSFRLITLYRPPPSKKNKLSVDMFLRDFSSLLEVINLTPHKLIITGDFNFHVDVANDKDAQNFTDLLDSAGLQQHISFPTHKKGHTLDLIISNKDSSSLIHSTASITDLPSDHYAVACKLDTPRPRPTKLLIRFRKIKQIDLAAFKVDISTSILAKEPYADLNGLTIQYNNTLHEILNKHAPLKERYISLRPHAPWFSDSLRQAKQHKRRLERKYLKTKLEVDRILYKEQCHLYHSLLQSAKNLFYKQKLESSNQRQLFQFIKGSSYVKSSPQLPSHSSINSLAENFGTFFSTKISTLRNTLQTMSTPHYTVMSPNHKTTSVFNQFQNISPDHIRKVIMESRSKYCLLDPLPTSLVKDCIPALLPIVTNIVNMSLSKGEFPNTFKDALVMPIIKKNSLNREELNNYRPISNLAFLSKVLERIVANQMTNYLSKHNLMGPMQSAYRKCHSTETALLRVYNDISLALDNHKEVILVMLDLSAAFDTIDHEILLERLHNNFGFTGPVLSWFTSYLHQRSQYITINNTKSSFLVETFCGVPQGSVLGPLLFTLYISPIEDLINAHNLNYMMYADDSQLFIIIDQSHLSSGILKLENCIKDIKNWNTANKLVCNPGKTEVLHFSSRFLKRPEISGINFDNILIKPVESVRDLGVHLDRYLNMRTHINKICSSATLSLRNIARLKKYLTNKQLQTLIHALITSKLDYCNSLLYGLPDNDLGKLQRIQNSAARLVMSKKRSDDASPLLYQLHWLPVKARIHFKILLFAYKCIHNQAPKYLSDLIKLKPQVRFLRSSGSSSLIIPRTSTKTYGDRAFSTAAPYLWNQLPSSIKDSQSICTFKELLKTHLFRLYFNC